MKKKKQIEAKAKQNVPVQTLEQMCLGVIFALTTSFLKSCSVCSDWTPVPVAWGEEPEARDLDVGLTLLAVGFQITDEVSLEN